MNSLIVKRYPYSLIISKEEAKKIKSGSNINEFAKLPSNNFQNILLAKLLISLTDSAYWKPAIEYLKGMLTFTVFINVIVTTISLFNSSYLSTSSL